jgi:heme-degrading monooxygenase HmoA
VASVKMLSKTPGFIIGKELTDKGLTFWTLTIWQNEASMKTFRNSAPHRKAMQGLPRWCNEASYVHWIEDDEHLPDWDTVYKKMIEEGKITKVRKPSARQPEKKFPPLKWKKFERLLKPSVK